MMDEKSKERPLFTSYNRGVKVSCWKNQTKEGRPFMKYTIEKSYKDDGGEWKSTNSFSGSDLLILKQLISVVWQKENELK